MSEVETTLCLQCKLPLPYSERSRHSSYFMLLNCECQLVFEKERLHYKICLYTGCKEIFQDSHVKATTYIQHPTKKEQLLGGQEVTLSGNKCKLWVDTVNMFMQKFPLYSETEELKIVVILTGIPVTTSGPVSDGASSIQVLNDREAEDMQQLVEFFSKLLNDTKWADVLLECRDGKTLRAHSWLLALKSAYFDENLKNKGHFVEGGTSTKVYRLQVDVDQETMKKVLRYIYLNQTPHSLDAELACSLYVAAERFSLQRLKNNCWEWMLSNVNSENFIACLKAAHRCQCDTFKEAVIAFISHHREVLKGDRWKNFIDPNNLAIEVLQKIVTSPSI